MTDGRLVGRVALVTGAGTGIGRAAVVRLTEDGALVVASSRTLEHVRETCAAAAASARVRPEPVELDVTDRAQVDAVVRDVVDRHGRLDVLVLNAGVELPHAPSLEATTDEDWDHLFRVNVTGMFTVLRAALPHLSRGASIVTVGSINSLVAWPDDAAYTATKGAVLQLTRAVALEVAPRGVRANCVCPGVIDTPLTRSFINAADDPLGTVAEYDAVAPLGRMGTAREIANCIAFLASDEASFVTGSALVVDGGTTAR